MKSRRHSLYIIIFLLLGSTLQWNCYKDLDCHNEKVGESYLDESTKAFIPLDTSKALVFKNALGDEMRFVCRNPSFQRLDLEQEVICIQVNLSFNYKYVGSDYWVLPYQQDSIYAEEVRMSFIVRTKSVSPFAVKVGDKLPFYDWFEARLGFNLAGSGDATINYVVSQRDSDAGDLAEATAAQAYRAIADTTILGKQFTDVLASVPGFGTQPDEHYSLLYQKNVGPVAFSTKSGTVYVFDRVE